MTVKDNREDEFRIAASLDACGLVCPMPLIRLQAKIESLACGEILELLADDPGVEDDLPAWSAQTGHRLLEIQPCAQGWRAWIQKTCDGVSC